MDGFPKQGWQWSLSPDGTLLAIDDRDTKEDEIQLWDIATGEQLDWLEDVPYKRVYFLMFSPDGRFLVSSAQTRKTNRLILWDIANRTSLWRLESRWGIHAAITPDSKTLFLGAYGNTILSYDILTGKKTGEWELDARYDRFVLSPDGRWLATCVNYSTNVSVYDTTKRRLHRVMKCSADASHGEIMGIQFSPDSKRLALGSTNQEMIVFDVQPGLPAFWYNFSRRGGEKVDSFAFSPDGKFMVCSGGEVPIVFDFEKNDLRQGVKWQEEPRYGIGLVRMLPDSKHVISYDHGGVIRIWEIPPWQDPPPRKKK